MKLKKFMIYLFLVIEVIMLVYYKDNIIEIFPFFSEVSANRYEDVIMGLVSSLVILMLEFINWLIVEQCVFNCKNTTWNIMRWGLRLRKKQLKSKIKKIKNTIFSVSYKWGLTQNQTTTTIANTAEGLICCADCIDSLLNDSIISAADEAQIKRLLDDLVNKLDKSGYKSCTQGIYTVHCTSMALYVIKRFIDLEKYSINENVEDTIKQCLKNLLDNSSIWGWGFANKLYPDEKCIRVFSTFWALRALNIWGYSGNKQFRNILYSLVQHNSEGLVGFSYNCDAQRAPTAMLCILATEIQNKITKEKLLSIMDPNMQNIISFLLAYSTDIEVEEYYVDSSTTTKLSWTHMTECLVLKTMMLYKERLNWLQIIRVAILLKRACNKIEETGYYHVKSMNWNNSDPFVYPSTYFISLICSVLQLDKK